MDTRKPDKAAPAAEDGRATPAPLVSVIVGVYNKERFVGECLRSVLAQTYKNWELIVVDDASTDNSLAEVERAVGSDPRVRIIRRATNSGHPSVPRNNALAVAKGEILMLLDGDDVWIPQKMEVQVAWMQAHPSFRFCHARCWKVDEEDNILQIRHEAGLPPSGDYRQALAERMWVATSTMAFWRDLYEKVGSFNETRTWAGEEDGEYAWRCAKETEFGTIQEPLAKYRVSAENWTSKKWKGVGRDYLFFSHIYARPDLWQGVKTRQEMRHLLADIAIEGSQYWRARGDFAKAGWFAWQAVHRSPFSSDAWRQIAGCITRRL
jgi:glycosyltransferase involved in cell wall biosynthesis